MAPNGQQIHPTAEQLSAYGLGQLDAAQSAEVESHVAACSVCCQTLWSLPEDQMVSLLRRAFHNPPAAETPTSGATTVLPSAAAPSPAAPAELIDHPRYRILEVLGKGGMGVVYKAEHRLMERPVALKVIDRGLTGDAAVVERFRREVKAAAALNHPNIVHAYDAEQAGDSHFLVMEFVEGTTLAGLVEQRGPLPVAEACDYVRQAARGLQRAFEHGMVHRDIKPHILMRTPQGQVKVLDFGLARLAREANLSPAATATPAGPETAPGLTRLGTVMGTADYMAPEQAADARSADTRADVYSLGCTLYFLLTGRPPFPEGTVLDKILAHAQRTPPPLSDFRTDVPPALARVVARMTAKDPARRYQTPTEAAEALRPFTAERTHRRLPWPWRLTAAVLAAVAVAVVLALGTAAYHFFRAEATPPVVLKSFGPDDKPITQDGVTADQGGWKVEVKEPQTIRLFEIADPGVEDCRVIYEARMKTADLKGGAYLEMWCHFPEQGEFFSKIGAENPVTGTTDWASYETPFFLKKGERPDRIKLNVVVEGTGTLWIKDVKLRKTSLPRGFAWFN